MVSKTYPYGTRREVRVDKVIPGRHRTVICSAGREGFFLVNEHADVEVGDVVAIVFTKGGPTGGYWKIARPRTARSTGC